MPKKRTFYSEEERKAHLKRVHSLLKSACYAFRNRTERFGKAR